MPAPTGCYAGADAPVVEAYVSISIEEGAPPPLLFDICYKLKAPPFLPPSPIVAFGLRATRENRVVFPINVRELPVP